MAGFAALRSGRASALSGLAWLCPVVAIWLRSSLFALRPSAFVPVVSCLRCDLLRLVLASLRYGLARSWLCRCPVLALCSGLDRLRRSGLVMPGCLRSDYDSALLCRCLELYDLACFALGFVVAQKFFMAVYLRFCLVWKKVLKKCLHVTSNGDTMQSATKSPPTVTLKGASNEAGKDHRRSKAG